MFMTSYATIVKVGIQWVQVDLETVPTDRDARMCSKKVPTAPVNIEWHLFREAKIMQPQEGEIYSVIHNDCIVTAILHREIMEEEHRRESCKYL